MRVFEKNGKFNFVDENDVLVGYDSEQDCCEHAGWFVADKVIGHEPDTPEPSGEQLLPYRFDYSLGYQEVEVEDDWLDQGGCVAFRLVAEGKPDLYLHLFNCQNGFYSHGFEVSIKGEVKDCDQL